MALTCINKNTSEYQNLKKLSDIPEILLDATCREYLERFNRFPRLDELPFTNSEKIIKQELNIKNDSIVIDKILEYTGKETLEEAIQSLNSTFLDLEIDIDPIIEKGLISVKKKPTEEFKEVENKQILNNSNKVIVDALDKLSKLYGIKINQIEDKQLSKMNINPSDKITKAFIKNGEIYINIDRYSPDSFVHEMMHLLIGSMRFTNPEMYQQLIDQVEQFDLYPELLRKYESKSRNDAKEEIFVTELGKYLAGMDSVITKLSDELLYEINYNVRRILDSMLMGDFSSKIIDDLYHSTFSEVVKMTNSDIMDIKYDHKSSMVHRKLNNTKSDLLKKGELLEICD